MQRQKLDFRCRQCEIRKESNQLGAIGWRIPRKVRGREGLTARTKTSARWCIPRLRGDERGQGSAPGREVRGRRNCIGLLPIDGQVTLRGDSPPGVAS